MDDGGNTQFSWPMLAMIGAAIVTITTGAIQLGSVQTHVVINTDRLSKLEQQNIENIATLATLKAAQIETIRRLDEIKALLEELRRK